MADILAKDQVEQSAQESSLESSNIPKQKDSDCSQAGSLDPPKEESYSSLPHSRESSNRIESPECNNETTQIEKSSTNIPTKSTSLSAIEQQLLKARRDLENMVLKYAKSERENLQNKQTADMLDKKLKQTIKDNNGLASRIKLLTNDKIQLTDTLNAKVAQLTVLEQKNAFLNNIQGGKLKDYEEKIKKLEVTNEELNTLIDSYKSKEGELLDFSERLSMKHMMLQSELDEARKNMPDYKDKYEEIYKERSELIKEKEELTKQLNSLADRLKTEQERSENLRNEMTENEVNYNRKLDELENEIKVIRRKHQIATKNLIKEIKQLHVQLEKNVPTATTQPSQLTT